MAIDKDNDDNIPDQTEAYYEELASREEVYLEETEEELRMILICEESAPIPKQELRMPSKTNSSCVAESLDEQRNHAAEELITGDSDDPPLFLEAFIAAAQKGDMAGLEHLFAEDVVSYSDGGGLVRAAGVPVTGRKRVATFIAAVSTWCWKGVALDWVETNGQAGVLILRDGVPIGLTVDASAQGINEIMWFLRPSKLSAISKSGQRVNDGSAAA